MTISRFAVILATALAVAGCSKKDGPDPFKDARVGNEALTLPEGIPIDSLKHMKALANCTRGVFNFENKLCFGQGELFHIPAELAVEFTPAGELHQVSYSFATVAKKRLMAELTAALGAARDYDDPRVRPPRTVCWPLVGGDEVVLDESNDLNAETLNVAFYSQVAANMARTLVAQRRTCAASPAL